MTRRETFFVTPLKSPSLFIDALNRFIGEGMNYHEYRFEIVHIDGNDWRIDCVSEQHIKMAKRTLLVGWIQGFIHGWNEAVKMKNYV